MDMEKNEYTPELYTLEDEDGKEQEFELLDVMEVDGEKYYALTPYFGEDPQAYLESDGEVVILKEDFVDGEPMLVSIDEDEEYERIGKMFLDRLNEIYGDEDFDDEEDAE